MQRTFVLGALAATAMVITAAAQAQDPAPPPMPATAGVGDDTLVVRGTDGAEKLNVVVGPDQVVVGGAVPGAGCAATAGGAVCNRGGFSRIDLDVGTGDDDVTVRNAVGVPLDAPAPLPGRVVTGGGDDKLGVAVPGPSYDTGEGDDSFTLGGFVPVIATGGPGRDLITLIASSPGNVISLDGVANDGPVGRTTGNVAATFERLLGGGGDDVLDASKTPFGVVLAGGLGNDRLVGGKGNDTLGVDDGADVYAGGGGVDTLNYGKAAKSGVTVTLDNKANDGRTGEKDNIGRDIERLGGTNFVDIFNLSASNRAGYTVVAGAGDDSIRDSRGANLIDGGAGDDSIKTSGDAGTTDRVGCGAGIDTASIGIDDTVKGCEKVSRVNDTPR